MIAAMNSSISGVVASFNLQSVSAHNVANSNTDGFKSRSAHAEEAYKGGVRVSLSRRNARDFSGGAGGGEALPSDTDYAKESTSQIGAKHLLSANIAALKTQDEMLGTLLDVFA